MATERAQIRRESDGVVHEYVRANYPNEAHVCLYGWTDGNYGCDCNRALLWNDPDAKDESSPCSHGKYLVRLWLDDELLLAEF